MTITLGDEPRAILVPKALLVLTDTEIARSLGISEEAARALIKAAFS